MRKNAGAGKTALAGAVSVAMALTLGVPTTALADTWGGGEVSLIPRNGLQRRAL